MTKDVQALVLMGRQLMDSGSVEERIGITGGTTGFSPVH